ncbi:MAG: hypothetical protein JO036_03020 [Candidatus Eremiobacteraeota bacterium]|nr:hypothetical protein [Candidatus Eremiobacteraeota bacterium]
MSARACVAAAALIMLALGSEALQNRDASGYRGARFGEVLGNDELARAGALAFSADRRAQIRGAFNASFCSECHFLPTAGGSQVLAGDFVIKRSAADRAATFQRYVLVHGFPVRRRPPARRFVRIPPPLYGIGLLEAVSDAELERVAADEAQRTPRHRGRIARLRDARIGRFGWKATSPAVRAFVAGAFPGELGVPAGDEARDVAAITAFLQRLAAPPQAERTGVAPGRAVFETLRCADCHRMGLALGRFAPEPQLSGTTIAPYTDLLLHDMGARAAELRDGAATAREFRTAPLWGVASTGPPYLHDGAARSLREAIALHGGQAADSAAAFARLSTREREALLGYLTSL